MDEKTKGRPERSLEVANNLTVPPRLNTAQSLSPVGGTRATKVVERKDDCGDETAMKVALIGAGQGGTRLAQAFYSLGYRRVAAVNTTPTDFEGIDPDLLRFVIPVGGAGKDTERAHQAMRPHREDLRDLLTKSWSWPLDVALVCATLGGGTGSGLAPDLVQLARDYMVANGAKPRVGALVSLPRVGEGQRQAANAVRAFRALLELKVSPLIVVDNARINSIYSPPMGKLHLRANEVVCGLFHCFNKWAAVHSSYVTFDQSEFSQLLDSGIVVLGATSMTADELSNPADVSTRVRADLANNVLAAVDLTRGRKAACLFIAEQSILDRFSSAYFDAGTEALDRIIGSGYAEVVDTVVHSGVYAASPSENGSGLQIFTMVGALEPPMERLKELATKGGVDGRLVSTLASFLGV